MSRTTIERNLTEAVGELAILRARVEKLAMKFSGVEFRPESIILLSAATQLVSVERSFEKEAEVLKQERLRRGS